MSETIYRLKVSRDPLPGDCPGGLPRDLYFDLVMTVETKAHPIEEFGEDFRQSVMTAAMGLVREGAWDVPVYAPGGLSPVGSVRRVRQ